MANPVVSVVMSVYNGEKYLREAIDSILEQTFTNYEFIIINDGSTDRSLEIIKSYKDPRIVLVDRENRGLVASLNEGIERAKGKYIARQDADDISQPKRLELEYEHLVSHHDIKLVSSSYSIIDKNGKELGVVDLLPHHDQILLDGLIRNPFCHGSSMYERQTAIDKGLYKIEDYPAEDYGLFSRIAHSGRVANIVEPLYRWRREDTSISHANDSLQRVIFAGLLDEVYSDWSETSLVTKRKQFNTLLKAIGQTQAGLTIARLPILFFFKRNYRLAATVLIRSFLLRPAVVMQLIRQLLCMQDWMLPQKLRILIVRNAENIFGGAESAVLQLSKSLTSQHLYPVIATTVGPLLVKAKRLKVDTLKDLWLSNARGKRGALIALIKLPTALLVAVFRVSWGGFSVVNTHSRDDQIIYTVSRLIHRKPVVWSDHGDMKHHLSLLENDNVVGMLYRYSISRAHTIIFVSTEEERVVLRLLSEQGIKAPKTIVIPNGLLLRDYLLEKTGRSKVDSVRIIMVGNLFPSKGAADLIQATAGIRDLGKKVRVSIIGDGPQREELNELVRRNQLSSLVKLEGFSDDVFGELLKSDIFVLPTRYEGAPLSVLEAMYASLPVVAYSVGGIPEQIQNGVTGYLVKPGDVGALKKSIIKLIDDDELRRGFGKKGHDVVVTNFDLGRQVKQKYLKLIAEATVKERKK